MKKSLVFIIPIGLSLLAAVAFGADAAGNNFSENYSTLPQGQRTGTFSACLINNDGDYSACSPYVTSGTTNVAQNASGDAYQIWLTAIAQEDTE